MIPQPTCFAPRIPTPPRTPTITNTIVKMLLRVNEGQRRTQRPLKKSNIRLPVPKPAVTHPIVAPGNAPEAPTQPIIKRAKFITVDSPWVAKHLDPISSPKISIEREFEIIFGLLSIYTPLFTSLEQFYYKIKKSNLCKEFKF